MKQTKLPKPNNQASEILYELLTNNRPLSFMNLYERTGCINLGQRISDLRRHGLQGPCIPVSHKNKFGRVRPYGTWTVRGEKELAREVYFRINAKK
jgi:hypothetical protein